MKKLVLFDFDGTLTTKDTLLEFFKFFKGDRQFYLGLFYLSPILVLFKCGIIKNWRAKEIFITYFARSVSIDAFQESCRKFALNKVPLLIREEALAKLMWHKLNGDEIYVVSASPENWVGPYCDSISVKFIATQLEVINEKLTGKILGWNCYGPEKAKRIRDRLDLNVFISITSYGDSRGDKEMLELANYRFYRRF